MGWIMKCKNCIAVPIEYGYKYASRENCDCLCHHNKLCPKSVSGVTKEAREEVMKARCTCK